MTKKTDPGRQFITIDRRTFLGALGATGLVAAGLPRISAAAETTSSTKSSGSSMPLRDGWKMQSATELQMAGEGPPSADSGKWYPVTVPCTVLAGLVANGEYPDLFFGDNLKKVPTDRFSGSWWYQTQFKLPEGAGQQVWLYFKGINYRANIWLNGKKIGDAKDVVGTYRDFEFNVTDAVKRDGTNTLMVEVQPPKKNDLAITFVDWAPHPPDQNMGLWQDVELRTERRARAAVSERGDRFGSAVAEIGEADGDGRRGESDRQAGERRAKSNDFRIECRSQPAAHAHRKSNWRPAKQRPVQLSPEKIPTSLSTIRLSGGPRSWASRRCTNCNWQSR